VLNRIQSFSLRVRGELACFTRPEFKTERVSYDVPTPSAVRGILEAILWKPAIRWQVRKILLLKQPRLIQFKRNEVNSKTSMDKVRTAMKRVEPVDFCADEDRAQRNTVALAGVDFAIEAEMWWTARRGTDDNPQKFREMFQRRIEKGQFHMQPYLGCREFPCSVEPYSGTPEPADISRDLGWMLHDIHFSAGDNRPVFFEAKIVRGIIHVPEWSPAS
jgi:CRISPR-associated protein Cas5d